MLLILHYFISFISDYFANGLPRLTCLWKVFPYVNSTDHENNATEEAEKEDKEKKSALFVPEGRGAADDNLGMQFFVFNLLMTFTDTTIFGRDWNVILHQPQFQGFSIPPPPWGDQPLLF